MWSGKPVRLRAVGWLTKPRDVAASFVRLHLASIAPPSTRRHRPPLTRPHRLAFLLSFHLAKTFRTEEHSDRRPCRLKPSKTTHPVSRQSNTTSPNAPLFPLLYISASLPCHMDPALASLSRFYIANGSLPFLSLPSRRTKHEHRPCLDLASSLAPSIQHSFSIQFDPQTFLSLPRRAGFVAGYNIFTLFSYLLLTPVRSELVSIASPRRINTHRMASLNGRQLWPISPSLSCALSFYLFCLIDSEPATMLSPSKSFAIPYGPSSRRRLTPILDRSVSVHRSGGCAINSRQPVTPISLHRASSLLTTGRNVGSIFAFSPSLELTGADSLSALQYGLHSATLSVRFPSPCNPSLAAKAFHRISGESVGGAALIY